MEEQKDLGSYSEGGLVNAVSQNSTGWLDIATAPKDGTAVLFFDGEYDRIFVGSYMRITSTGKMEWAANVHSFVVFRPSHWQPLPPPPGQNT